MRSFSSFSYKETQIRCSSSFLQPVSASIKENRKLLDHYIESHPDFLNSLSPLKENPRATRPARLMMAAAGLTGLGPMASVAGCLAQLAVEKALTDKTGECIVDNGGDLFMQLQEPLLLGVYAGNHPLSGKVALEILPEQTPLSVCSSSRMGHSLSLGNADLVTVFSQDGALADSAATLGGNLVQSAGDLPSTAERLCAIPGIAGCLLMAQGQTAMAGTLPRLVKTGGEIRSKVNRHPGWILE